MTVPVGIELLLVEVRPPLICIGICDGATCIGMLTPLFDIIILGVVIGILLGTGLTWLPDPELL